MTGLEPITGCQRHFYQLGETSLLFAAYSSRNQHNQQNQYLESRVEINLMWMIYNGRDLC